MELIIAMAAIGGLLLYCVVVALLCVLIPAYVMARLRSPRE